MVGLTAVFVLSLGAGAPAEWPAPPVPPEAVLDVSPVAAIPVQAAGRHAPFDTFARRAVRTVTGRERWAGHDAVRVVLSWALEPQRWSDAAFVKVEHEPLKLAVGLPPERRHFSPAELSACQPLYHLIDLALRAEREGLRPDGLQRQALDVADRMSTLDGCLSGRTLAFVPRRGAPNAAWSTCEAAPGEISGAWNQLRHAWRQQDDAAFCAASVELARLLRIEGGDDYPSATLVGRELFYNRLHPFRWSWVVMSVGMVVGLAGLWVRRRAWDRVTMTVILAACALFTLGFALRWLVAGRAPLANMYESLTVFAASVPLFALALFALFRQRLVLPVSAGLSAAGLILADVLPLESAITTLPPVLRNTVWLTIHVLTIMLGYGAAALSMGIAHVQLGLALGGPRRAPAAREAMRLNYWTMLVAVIFLTAGIVFGSIWANASWGRYWGWDPKETWSLITLLGYLGVLHARYTGWLRDVGVAVASIGCFQLVLMTYYGVNYVLGTGLHSYGFGAGGIGWVLTYVGAEAAIVGLALWRLRYVRSASQAASRATQPEFAPAT